MSSLAVATRSRCGHCRRASGSVPMRMRSSAAIVCGNSMPDGHADALVLFGATGDLAYEQIFPALQAMIRRSHLDVPVIGVAKPDWTVEQLRARAQQSIAAHGGLDAEAF